jgi:AcrR family transcriptional regulator
MAKPKTRAPRWRRRKDARPAEIIDAAFSVFSERGYSAARLSDIAQRAGVAKASLYLYFETKEDLFRAVVRTAIAPNFAPVRQAAENFQGPFRTLIPMILTAMARVLQDKRLPGIVKMVIGESRNFPDLARIWHDGIVAVALATVAGVIARGQAGGEFRPGDPRLYAFSLAGPMLMAVLYRNVFDGFAADPPDLEKLAAQHAATILPGLLVNNDG